eukprot:jgi/Botrbrau1/5240/Bobra.0172s0102.1
MDLWYAVRIGFTLHFKSWVLRRFFPRCFFHPGQELLVVGTCNLIRLHTWFYFQSPLVTRGRGFKIPLPPRFVCD